MDYYKADRKRKKEERIVNKIAEKYNEIKQEYDVVNQAYKSKRQEVKLLIKENKKKNALILKYKNTIIDSENKLRVAEGTNKENGGKKKKNDLMGKKTTNKENGCIVSEQSAKYGMAKQADDLDFSKSKKKKKKKDFDKFLAEIEQKEAEDKENEIEDRCQLAPNKAITLQKKYDEIRKAYNVKRQEVELLSREKENNSDLIAKYISRIHDLEKELRQAQGYREISNTSFGYIQSLLSEKKKKTQELNQSIEFLLTRFFTEK